ncbi:MAG: GNAT family N-acetyltransferase [Alphaproteobacteria bacterium]
MTIELVVPALAHLPSYAAALERGWSPDNMRDVSGEQRDQISKDPTGFLASQDDPEARAGPVVLPDGSSVPRLPSIRRWIWDGAFCGSIGLRWQSGTSDLPPSALGHVGFAVVPWKRNRGHATRALALLLPEARARGLDHVEVTADPEKLASQRVITANGGRLIERFRKPAAYGGTESLRFRIDL